MNPEPKPRAAAARGGRALALALPAASVAPIMNPAPKPGSCPDHAPHSFAVMQRLPDGQQAVTGASAHKAQLHTQGNLCRVEPSHVRVEQELPEEQRRSLARAAARVLPRLARDRVANVYGAALALLRALLAARPASAPVADLVPVLLDRVRAHGGWGRVCLGFWKHSTPRPVPAPEAELQPALLGRAPAHGSDCSVHRAAHAKRPLSWSTSHVSLS